MENKTPDKILARMQVVHFGKILFNLQFIALAVMAASALTFILPALYYLVLILVTMLSLFMLFVNPEFRALWAGGETLTKVAEALAHSWQYTVPLLAVLSAVSIVCLCFDKNEKHPARIVVSALMFIAAMVVLIAKLINSGAAQ